MRIGTRGSALALAQAELVARLLGGAEIEVIRTSGDDRAGFEPRGGSLHGASDDPVVCTGAPATPKDAAGDKSRWVDAIERALLDERIDLAVHSAKDLPGELPDGLALLGTTARAEPHDALCGAQDLEQLGPGSRVGTSSLRRRAQLLAMRPDIEVVPLTGNVDTRLARLREGAGSLQAIMLARAGLERLGLESQANALPLERFVPSPGQGALALEGRSGDERIAAAVDAICDRPALSCLRAERALALALGADCHTPFGAYAWEEEGRALALRGWSGLPDGSEWILDEVIATAEESPEQLARRVAERMRSVGAEELLAAAEAMAA